jgi:RNA polymerase sigma-70 factor (ECF subfamily)
MNPSAERPSYGAMLVRAAEALPSCQAPPELRAAAATRDGDARLRAIVHEHLGFLWRSLRRLGVTERDVDDAAQRALGVLSRRVSEIDHGRERAFLFQTALRIAAEWRRSRRRDRLALDPDAIEHLADSAPLPDESIARRQRRALLDEILDAMEMDVRAVFVLFELEQMTTNEISALLGIPAGTVSSRLRRGREEFHDIARRVRAQHDFAARRTPQGGRR